MSTTCGQTTESPFAAVIITTPATVRRGISPARRRPRRRLPWTAWGVPVLHFGSVIGDVHWPVVARTPVRCSRGTSPAGRTPSRPDGPVAAGTPAKSAAARPDRTAAGEQS